MNTTGQHTQNKTQHENTTKIIGKPGEYSFELNSKKKMKNWAKGCSNIFKNSGGKAVAV